MACMGCFSRDVVYTFQTSDVIGRSKATMIKKSIIIAIAFPIPGTPAIGGFVVVGKMVMEYGACMSLPEH